MEIQTHYLADVAASMHNALKEGKNWLVFDGRGYMTSPNYLQYFASPDEARKQAGIDFSIPTHQRAVLLQPIADSVNKLSELQQAGQIKFGHVVSVNIDKILNDFKQERPRVMTELTKAGNPYEKNIEELNKQVVSLGFTTDLLPKLKDAFEKGEKEFMIPQVDEAGKKTTAATLHFRETVNGDRVVLDRFNTFLQKTPNADPIQQTFFVSERGTNINYHEAVNLLHGRAIAKEVTNAEGEKNKVWLQLDLKNINERGQFEIKQISGYDIYAVLDARPIKESKDVNVRAELGARLERGERVAVTFEEKSIAMKAYIEAAPQFKTLHYFDDSQKRISFEQIKNTLDPGHKKAVQQENTKQLKEGTKRKLSV